MIADRIRSIQSVSGGGGGGGGATDPDFLDVELLLRMDGLDGSAVFIDASKNNAIVTSSGGAKISTTYGRELWGYSSGYFIAATSKLNIAAVAASGTGDFTYEGWIYPVTAPGSLNIILDHRLGGAHTSGMFIYFSNTLKIGVYNVTQSSNSLTLNSWNHFAFVRSSGVLTYYINGVSGGSVSFTRNNTATNFVVGKPNDSIAYGAEMYLDDVRYTLKARYTSNFTPPESAFPIPPGYPLADPYNSLILNMQGTAGTAVFTDDSPNALAVTPYGDAVLVSDATFGTVASFDGSGDYLSIPSNAAFAFGTGDFTVEAWVKLNTLPSFQGTFFSVNNIANGDAYAQVRVTCKNNGSLYFLCARAIGTWISSGTSAVGTISIGQWYHIACVRSGNVFTLYVNGTNVLSYSSTLSLYDFSGQSFLGCVLTNSNPTEYINGLIGPLRITKGVARYTSNFTPPTGLFPTS